MIMNIFMVYGIWDHAEKHPLGAQSTDSQRGSHHMIFDKSDFR